MTNKKSLYLRDYKNAGCGISKAHLFRMCGEKIGLQPEHVLLQEQRQTVQFWGKESATKGTHQTTQCCKASISGRCNVQSKKIEAFYLNEKSKKQ